MNTGEDWPKIADRINGECNVGTNQVSSRNDRGDNSHASADGNMLKPAPSTGPMSAEQWIRAKNNVTGALDQSELDVQSIVVGGCEPEEQRLIRLGRVADAYAAHVTDFLRAENERLQQNMEAVYDIKAIIDRSEKADQDSNPQK